jgi:hypothetical protein
MNRETNLQDPCDLSDTRTRFVLRRASGPRQVKESSAGWCSRDLRGGKRHESLTVEIEGKGVFKNARLEGRPKGMKRLAK